MHFHRDVAAADEFTFDVNLRDGRPVGVLLDAFPDIVIFQHIDGVEGDSVALQDVNNLRGKSAHWLFRCALHEDGHRVGFNFFFDALHYGLFGHGFTPGYAMRHHNRVLRAWQVPSGISDVDLLAPIVLNLFTNRDIIRANRGGRHHMNPWKLAIRAIPAAILLFASACGSHQAQAANPVKTSGVLKYERQPSAYDKLPPAKRGGTLYQQLSGNPKVINPILGNDNNSRALEGYLWATLFSEDSDTLSPLPYLAESFEVSPDRKSYTFVLNKAAKWADGTSVTTDDVKFTFDKMMDPKTEAAPLRVYWETVKLAVKDGRTFTFTVAEPKFDTLRSLYLFSVVNKKQFEKEPDFNKARAVLNPIGNGPYAFKSFNRDQSVVLTRNKTWWGYELPHFKNRFNADEVNFRVIVDDNLAYEKFLRGDLDLMGFNAEQFAVKVQGVDKDKIGKSAQDIKVGKKVWAQEIQNRAPRGYNYVGWNMRLPLFASVKTRRAMARLLDYKQVINKVYYGFQFQCTSPFGSLSPNSAEDLRSKEKMLTFDRKAALAMLKADGWADTDKDNILDKEIGGKRVPFKFELKYNSNNALRGKIAQILKDNFKAAGIDVTVKAVEWNAYLDDIDHRKFDAFILGWTATPYPNAKQIWHSDSEKDQGSNIVAYSNKKVDALIEKSNVEMDARKRQETMKEINRLIYEDQPYMFLSEPRSVLAGFTAKVGSPSGVWAMQYDVSPPDDLYQFVP